MEKRCNICKINKAFDFLESISYNRKLYFTSEPNAKKTGQEVLLSRRKVGKKKLDYSEVFNSVPNLQVTLS